MLDTALAHGLFVDYPPPSREALQQWLRDHGVWTSGNLDLCEMDVEGSQDVEKGWRVVSHREMDEYELICSIPKTAILSSRSSSLPPISLPTSHHTTSHTILHFTLCVLHEIRLGRESPFFGYLQALPRDPRSIALPYVWGVQELAGDDGALALAWLKGTETEKDMKRKNSEGLGLEDVCRFYSATGSLLPPTPTHLETSPLFAFLHVFNIVSTRAFLVDLYHTIALCPFADMFNHSSLSPHTSLSSDDYVCHQCGSLKTCSHDITNLDGIPGRLSHLGERERRRIENEKDTVEMRAERKIEVGEEIFNCYGEGIGDSRLLVEWGFITEEFAGDGLTWDIKPFCSDLIGAGQDTPVPLEVIEVLRVVSESTEEMDIEDDEHGLFSPIIWKPSEMEIPTPILNLDQNARVSILFFSVIYLATSPDSLLRQGISDEIIQAMDQVNAIWKQIRSHHDQDDEGEYDNIVINTSVQSITPTTGKVVRKIRQLLYERSTSMFRPEMSLQELYDLREKRLEDKFQSMALLLTINERQLLNSGMQKWDEWLRFYYEA